MLANNLPEVNILTWWNYLSYPWEEQAITDACHVTISFDQYYSNAEFGRRWKESRDDYDVIIFEDLTYSAIKKQIPSVNSNLYLHSKDYNPTIKTKYLSRHYPPNIAFFYQSVTGFIWNPSALNINAQDNVKMIFEKAANGLAVIVDDPLVFQNLQVFGAGIDSFLNFKIFKEIVNNTEIFITNDYDKIYTDPKFALSYIWSGEAIYDITNANKNFKFLIRPDISYISSDLLAQLDNKPGVACVAEYLTSKAFLTRLQNDTYYFSPYGDASQVQNPTYKNIYMNYLKNLPQLRWIEPLSDEKIADLTQTWKMIRLANSK